MKHFGTIGDSANIHVEGAAREELKVWGWRDPILHVRRVFFRPVCIASSLGFGKRNELCFARHRGESSALPIFFRLLDPFHPRGHEIPPDVAWALQCRAAEKHQARRARFSHRDLVARLEDQKPRPVECLARNIDLALDDINRPLFNAIAINYH